MRKKLLKLVSLVLVLMLAVTVLAPGTARAEGRSAAQIEQQIRRTYSKALSLFRRSSFDGYCGTLTGYQLYILGITAQPDLRNGKDGYDTYCRSKVSSGGYGIRAYSAKSWTLREALDEITDNGTKDAYNMLVGFQSTPSSAGRKYGHSCVIHAIIGGRVYFMESYDVKLNGYRYREGAPINCTIEEFCAYYKMTTTKFDGVIHFGAKEYADICASYPSSFYAAALEAAELRSQPCTENEDSSSELITILTPGQQLQVIETIENTNGEFWYHIGGDQEGYVPAEKALVRQFLFEDVSVDGIEAPAVLRSGKDCKLKGEVTAEENSIYTVRSHLYNLNDDSVEQVSAASDIVEDKTYSVSRIGKSLNLKELEPGSYRYELAAVIGNYYYDGRQLQAQWETVNLWNSEFRVTEEKQESRVVTFDGVEARASLDSKAVAEGESLGTLPTVQRSGYVFLGWFTQPEGGEQVTADFVPQEDTTVYAHWSSAQSLQEAMTEGGQCWYFYADGVSTMGCVQLDGTVYYFAEPDAAGQSTMAWNTTY